MDPEIFNNGSYAQGDGLGALDLTDVNTHPTQASDQQNTLRADIVIDRHQLAFPRLRGGGASLYTGAQDSKCEKVKEQIREELKAEIELLKQNTMEDLKKVTWEKDMAEKELKLAKEKLDFANKTKEKEMEEKDKQIKELTLLTEAQAAQIRELNTDKERLQKTIHDMDIKMRMLNETVTNVQNQGSTLEAGLQQCQEAISENSEQREEQIKLILDNELEKRMREMFAEMASLNVPPATVQEATTAISKLQGDNKNVSPRPSHSPSPSRSPVNVLTPPPTPPTPPTQPTGQEQTN